MRKVIASALALAMVVPMGLTAFAEKVDSSFTFNTTLYNGDGVLARDAAVDTFKTGDDLYVILGLETQLGALTDDDLTKISFKKEDGGKYIGRPVLVEKKFKDYVNGSGRMVAIKLPIVEDWTDKEYKIEVDMEIGAKEDLLATGTSIEGFPMLEKASGVNTTAFTSGKYALLSSKTPADLIAAVETYLPYYDDLAEKTAETAEALALANAKRDVVKAHVTGPNKVEYAAAGGDAFGGTEFTGVAADYTALESAMSTATFSIDGTANLVGDPLTALKADVSAWLLLWKDYTEKETLRVTAASTEVTQLGFVNALLTGTGTGANFVTADFANSDFAAYKSANGGKGDSRLPKGDKLVVKGSFWLKNEKRSSEDETITVGQKGVVVKPVKNEENTVEWEDENDVIARMSFEADSSTTVYFPKLSTKWDNIYYAEKFDGQDAFVREFVSNPDISSTSRPVVELVVPYVDEDGDLTIAEDEIIVYQQIEDGELVDITSKGQFVENDNDELVFQIKTRQLGTYVFAEIPVEEQVADDEPVEEEGEESAEGGKANPGTGF